MSQAIRILIASSARLERTQLQMELQNCPDLQIVAVCEDIFAAWETIQRLKPSVILLDLEIFGGGSAALMHKVRQSCPTPIIALFSEDSDGQVAAAQALAMGAVDAQVKYKGVGAMLDMVGELSIRIFRSANRYITPQVAVQTTSRPVSTSGHASATSSKPSESCLLDAATRLPHVGRVPHAAVSRAILIGASTGGTQALGKLLENLPANLPGIAIVQHMPANFTGRLAERLNRRSDVTVVEAKEGMPFQPGHAYIAPGGRQFALQKVGADFRVALSDGPVIGGHKPSVEHLFSSMVPGPDLSVMAIMLTGMGADGSKAMKVLHDHGALTVAQDEASCVVFVMPREAILLGAVSHILSLDEIPEKIISFASDKSANRGAA